MLLTCNECFKGMDGDLYPHGSRILVDKQHVVQSQYVVPLQ